LIALAELGRGDAEHPFTAKWRSACVVAWDRGRDRAALFMLVAAARAR
jgi:hypothetical protein